MTALTNNPDGGFGYLDESEHPTPDFAALDKPARHRWGKEKFSGSFVCHARIAVCIQCGAERHRQFDYGQRRTLIRTRDDKWSDGKTPPCESRACAE